MQINLLFFATLRDLIGKNQLAITVEKESITIKELRTDLGLRFPAARENLKVALAAINEEFAFPESVVQDHDEVAFFPPVSGGMPDNEKPEIYRLATEEIDHNEIVQSITTPATGAVCLFSGFVRGTTEKAGHLPKTDYLEYEAYETMAVAKMKQVAHEIRDRWADVQGIAIIQRLGRLEVGDNTVLIACSSGHRDQGCFEAARYGIDRLKEIVPVWKKEVGVEGEEWIEGEYLPTKDD